MDLVALLLTIAVVSIIYYLLKGRSGSDLSKHVNKIPGPTPLPILGNSLNFLLTSREDTYDALRKYLPSFGSISRMWVGNIAVIEIMSPDDAEVILNNSIQITKGRAYDGLKPWLGEGLLTSTGAKWHRRRKLITPTFHFKILETFMESFVEKSQELVKHLKARDLQEAFDIYPYITHCTLDIICETAMGVQMNSMSVNDNEYIQAIYGISLIILECALRPWLKIPFIFNRTKYGKDYQKYLTILHEFTRRVISERRKSLLQVAREGNVKSENADIAGKKPKIAFLDLLLETTEDGNALSNEAIAEEVDTFMFEGHDTTTAGITWSLFLLGNHPKIQEEVYQEIETVFQGDKDKALTINDLAEMKLLERCIKEALRLYPSVPTISRLLTQDVTIDKYFVPAGCITRVHIFLLHRNPKYFPDPDRFDPDRFLPENMRDRHPFAYVPFSAGPRNCIGQKFAMYEEKTMLAYILKNFKVKALETQETVKPVMELVLRPFNGVRVILEPRT